MKKLSAILLPVTAAIIFWGFRHIKFDENQPINPVLGDKSFISKFGYAPDASTSDDLRIKSHLEYAENLLRQKDVSHMDKMEQLKRLHLLELLHEYRTAGVFPRNYGYADQRKPCFIDKDGRICAVGYLVEQTAGRSAAEQINSRHQYQEVFEMHDDDLDEWIAISGLTKEECAMIQPTYGPEPVYTHNYISTGNGIASALFGGVNLSLNTINGIQIGKGTNSKAVPVVGLITGAGQIIYGVIAIPEEQEDWQGTYTNESLKTLCFVNIGLGTSTMILSAWNLIANINPKSRTTSWNIYGYPARDKNPGLAFSLTHRF